MVLALILVLLSSALISLSPLLLKYLVDNLTATETFDGMHLTVMLLAFGYAGSQWLARTLGEFQLLVTGRANQKLYRRLSLKLCKHVMALPLSFHLSHSTGALSQTLTNGLLGYRIIVQHLILTILPVILELAVMSTVLIELGHSSFLAVIGASLICYAIAFVVGAARLATPARAASAAHITANSILTDSIVNYETIKSFCAERDVNKRIDSAFEVTEGHWSRFFRRKAFNGVIVAAIFALSLGASVYLAALEVTHGRMNLGSFVLVNTYMLQLFRPLEMLGFAFLDAAQGTAFIEKMVDLLQKDLESGPFRSNKRLPPGPGDLIFNDVSFSYSEECPVLRDVSFEVPAGRTVALVGESGAGKSSIIRLLARFWEPDSGCILLDSTPISDVSASSLRRNLAIVPQDAVLFNDSIAYNIAVGRSDCTAEQIIEAAKLARIHDFIVSQPKGYDTLVGERGLKLSGGERQRIAIARAALKRPRIFVFDEATSSLDSRTEHEIVQNLREAARGTTTLVIAHRLSTVVNADEILVLEHGKIVERGSHAALLGCNGIYRSMWATQNRDNGSRYATAR